MIVHKEVLAEVIPIDMKDGDVGVVISSRSDIKGKVVQRYEDVLIVLGKESGDSYSDICGNKNTSMLIRLLDKGTLLEL